MDITGGITIPNQEGIEEIYSATPAIFLLTVLAIFCTTIAFIVGIRAKGKTLPEHTSTICPKCNQKIYNFLTREKKNISPAHSVIILSNLISIAALLYSTITFVIIISDYENFILQIVNKTLSENYAYEFGQMLIIILLTLIHFALLFLNNHIDKKYGTREFNSIICICTNCGTITEYDAISKEETEEQIVTYKFH